MSRQAKGEAPLRRDPELMIELLQKLEDLPLENGAVAIVNGYDDELAIEGRSADEIEYHLTLLREAGLVDSPGSQPGAGGITFRRLTNDGHDALAKATERNQAPTSKGDGIAVFRQIDNAVTDLERSDYNTFGRHIKRLSRLLHGPELGEIVGRLIAGINIDTWLEASRKEEHGVGGSELEWPVEPERELGTCILLIDRFAADPDMAFRFSHEFYNISDNSITAILRHLVEQMIVPFARDFSDYVAPHMKPAQEEAALVQKGPKSRKVFVVHGRDDGSKTRVELFLRAIGLDPIILHQRPNKGRHILTKFQEESEGASFAVVIMAPDDEGGLIGGTSTKRARQNVVFELGYFIGVLGPGNVAALIDAEVEKPSDFAGIGYIELDAGVAWKGLLARELSAAEVPFDPMAVFRA